MFFSLRVITLRIYFSCANIILVGDHTIHSIQFSWLISSFQSSVIVFTFYFILKSLCFLSIVLRLFFFGTTNFQFPLHFHHFLLSFMAGCVLCIFPWHECPAKLRPVACVGVNSVAFNMPFHKFLRLLTLFTQMCAKATNNNANQLFITPYVAHTHTHNNYIYALGWSENIFCFCLA